MSELYSKAGVNLEAGYEVVRKIKKHVDSTKRLGMMGTIGSFGGMFDLTRLGYQEPVLVSGTDGVGTKLLIAIMLNQHDTIGEDLVAMCVNDVIAQGAEPLFFLDYIAVDKTNPDKIERILKGISVGCQKAGCAIIGGETAEMPDMYEKDHYDLAGFAVGVVEKQRIVTGEKVQVGDVLIGLPSSGIHSNGYSLVRKVFLKDNRVDLHAYHNILGKTIGEELLTPTKIYVKPVLSLLKAVDVHGMAHITGGGFDENIPRTLNSNQGVEIDLTTFTKPVIFDMIEELGYIPTREMYNIFNMGIGFVIVVSKDDVQKALKILENAGENPKIIGKVINKAGVHLL